MRCIHFDVTDSTNEQARRLAAAHPGETLLITAAEQTTGRGRLGRTWQSPRGGAWLTLAYPLRSAPVAYAGASLAAAAAVHRAIVRIAPEIAAELRIKWPNDLLLSGCKLAGILCEVLPASSAAGNVPAPAERSGVLLVGVGVNVDFSLQELSGELRHPAATLAAAVDRTVLVDDVIDAVAQDLHAALSALEQEGLSNSLLADLRANLADMGAVRTWHAPRGAVTGRIRGLDDVGRLLLEGPDGIIACSVGELACDQVLDAQR